MSSENRVNHTDKQLPLTNVAVHLNTDIILSLSPADSEQLERESPQSILTVDLGNMDGVRMNEAPTPECHETENNGQPESSSLSPRVDSESVTISADSPLFHPTRHLNTRNKLMIGDLEIKNPVVYLGDSNLSRIPGFTHPSIQIDSFTGASLQHLKGVVEKLTPQEETQILVIPAGLNVMKA